MHTGNTSARRNATGRRMTLSRLTACCIAGLLAGAAGQAAAQAYPTKPIRVISPYPAGLSPDLAMRVLADKLSRRLGQQVFIDSRPGGNGFIAINGFKQAPADGHTLLLVSNAHLTMNPYLFKKLPYDVEKDFAAISTIYRAPFFLAAAATGPYQNMGQIISKARAAPGSVTYSVPYIGSPPHFGGALLSHLSDTKMVAIPYKDGGQMVVATSTGEVDFTALTMGSLNPLVKAGKLKVIAVAAPSRSRVAPDVPTVEEAGGPKGMLVESWVGLVAPRGTPPQVIKKINEEITRAMGDADLINNYASDGVMPTAMTPAAMTQMIRADLKTNAKLLPQIGMQAE